MSNSTTRKQLFSPYKLSSYPLQSHLVMSPMIRNRAIGHVTNDLMVKYYAQRATAGLIITEGTSPSGNGLGIRAFREFFSRTSGRLGACHDSCRYQRRYNIYSVNAHRDVFTSP